MKIPIRQGYLFRPLPPQEYVQPLPFDSSVAQGRLHFYVERRLHVFGNRKVTLHGLRNGCAISLAMAGADIETVMDHVGWKTSSMPVDITGNYRRQNELLGFLKPSRGFGKLFINLHAF